MTTKDDLIVSVATRLDMLSVELRAIAAAGTQDPPPPPPPPAAIKGVWTSAEELATRPTSGPAWEALVAASRQDTSAPNLSNQDDPTNVRVLAAALVFARTGGSALRDKVIAACTKAVGTESGARALALARELPAYVIAADLVGYREPRFVTWVAGVRHAPMTGGPASLIASHEERPNNWGTHAAAARAACAAYLGDQAELERCARVFRGWLGDRDAYSAFSYGDPAWQADASKPVGINPKGTTKSGHSIDGVLADDQRRAGGFVWPPPKENYVWEALQGAVVCAEILTRAGCAGYLAFEYQDRALLRAVTRLHTEAQFPASGDDTFLPHIINRRYGTKFPAPIPSTPGKNCGFTCFTHA
jgi:hypothetical protein